MSDKDELYLTPDDLSRRWMMKIGTLAHWRSRGEGPRFLKLGGNVRYILSDVESYEAAQTRGGDAA